MPDQHLQTYTYWVLRYTPNLIRDEWLNIGILLHDPGWKRLGVRLLEEESQFAGVRRLHPNADLGLLRALQSDFEAQIDQHQDDLSSYITQLEETLSNLLQLSPRKAVLAEDFDAELDRLYREYVEPPHWPRAANTRSVIRARINEVFDLAGILNEMERHVRVEEFTQKGDPLRLDYGYRRNGTRGFVHALALSRDPAQAKVLAYTAGQIRAKLADTEFTAITEVEPRADNDRHQFMARLLAGQGIAIVPVAGLDEFANRLRPTLR